MKKGWIVVLLCLLTAGFAAAEDIDLGDFPVGKWLDETYDAVWSFSSDNIQLYRTDGRLVYDFRGEVEDFNVSAGMDGLKLTFNCPATERSYQFVKGLTNLDLALTVDRNDGKHHETDMKVTQVLDGLVL
ncbi:MAG: hypothetical protein P1P77_03530 [Spirochaetaceae bacterium]|nr:hypothetical protein [Spirochaetaceae bacterium]